jgi:transaldolase
MANNPCFQLRDAGTAVWLDQLSREIVQSGRLAGLVSDAALSGVTSNPAIFHHSMTHGEAYDAQLADLAREGRSTEAIYEELAVRDIQLACDVLREVHERTRGADGYVSLEVSPHLARDTEASFRAACDLHSRVGRPNLLIKIPGTAEGLPAIERCLEKGIPINVTLLFSIEAYEAVAEAYVRALDSRDRSSDSLQVASVASFFVSRIDTLTDQRLEERAAKLAEDAARKEILDLRGRAAIANARLAYQSYRRIFSGDPFRRLAGKGARVQRPLWASTSAKNPEYSDVMYVETLVGPDTVNTMPMQTIEAFLDHGKVVPGSVESGLDEARRYFERLEKVGISFREITDQLIEEGIRKFIDPYDRLLASLEEKGTALRSSR